MFGPKYISTPDFYDDLEKLLLTDVEQKDINSFRAKLEKNTELKAKVVFICGRFEFIALLQNLTSFFENKKKIELGPSKPIDDARVQIDTIENISFNGLNFAGIDYDIEALVIYLLLTCVDAINGNKHHITYDQWIVKNIDSIYFDGISRDEIVQNIRCSKDRYYAEYGVGRNFKRAFISDMSEELRDKIVSNFALLKINASNIDPNSFQKWQSHSNDKKIKLLVNHFFAIRNNYTHSSIRTFIPNTPIQNCFDSKNEVLIQLNNSKVNLIGVLIEIIQNLVYNKLKNEE